MAATTTCQVLMKKIDFSANISDESCAKHFWVPENHLAWCSRAAGGSPAPFGTDAAALRWRRRAQRRCGLQNTACRGEVCKEDSQAYTRWLEASLWYDRCCLASGRAQHARPWMVRCTYNRTAIWYARPRSTIQELCLLYLGRDDRREGACTEHAQTCPRGAPEGCLQRCCRGLCAGACTLGWRVESRWNRETYSDHANRVPVAV